MTVAVFARLCNMSASLESRLENGETIFSEDSIGRILKGTRVNKEWFMDGTGEMYPSNQTVGDRLKQLRTELKLTQPEMAKKSGISMRKYVKLEHEGGALSKILAERIERNCGVSTDWLYFGDEKSKNYPCGEEMISFLKENEEVRKIVWDKMKK